MSKRCIALGAACCLLSLWGPACDEGKSSLSSILGDCARLSACTRADPVSLGVTCGSIYRASAGIEDKDRGTETALAVALVDCLRRAKDCERAEACLKADEDSASLCSGADGEDRCAGDVLVECADYPDEQPDAFDCASAGLVCAEMDGDGACGESICDPDVDEDSCEGALLYECDDAGVWSVTDCRVVGGTCGTGLGGGVNCVGAGDACDAMDFQARCEGTTRITCLRGSEARVDCTLFGPDYVCGTTGGLGTIGCLPVDQECEEGDPESCTGGVVRFCTLGRWREVDCRDHGFSGCSSEFTLGGTVAFCTP